MADNNQPPPTPAARLAEVRQQVESLAEKTALAKAAADQASQHLARAGASASRGLQATASALARRYSEARSLWTEARKLLALLVEQQAHRQAQERNFSELFGNGQSPF